MRWIETLNGLNIWNHLQSSIRDFQYVNFPDINSDKWSSGWILSFFEDSDKMMWVSKYNGELP